jgi:hypothetical protein
MQSGEQRVDEPQQAITQQALSGGHHSSACGSVAFDVHGVHQTLSNSGT